MPLKVKFFGEQAANLQSLSRNSAQGKGQVVVDRQGHR